MTDLWSWWFASVRFEALGGRVEKLLDWCVERGIPLQQVCPIPGGFTARVPARRYRALRIPARRFGVRMHVLQRRGVWFRLRRWRGRWGLVLGVPVFLLTLSLSEKMIWAVRYQGQTDTESARIGQLLYQMEVQPGATLTQSELTAAEQRLMKECPELGWVTLNFSDGRLVVESDRVLQSGTPKQEMTGRLIAAEDAVLLSLNVRAGVTDKKAGQTVAAGETLIDSVKLDRSGQAVQRAADGEVWARVKKQYECRQPLTVSAQVPTGRLDRGWRLETAGRALEFPAASQAGEGWRVQEKERALTLMGFALPVTQVRILMVEYGQAEIKLSVEQAAAQAKWNCRRMLYEAYPDAQIRTESWMCEQDGGEVVCRWTVEFEADIARVAVSE